MMHFKGLKIVLQKLQKKKRKGRQFSKMRTHFFFIPYFDFASVSAFQEATSEEHTSNPSV
jgi:uncharacterized membrane protein (DUF485 family)